MNQGKLAEFKFLVEINRMGLITSLPTESASYDVIVDCREFGLKRVQIKSCGTRKSHGRRLRYRVDIARGSRIKKPYLINEVDIFAIYFLKEERWAIIPAAILEGKKWCNFYFLPECKYFNFLNEWEYFKK